MGLARIWMIKPGKRGEPPGDVCRGGGRRRSRRAPCVWRFTPNPSARPMTSRARVTPRSLAGAGQFFMMGLVGLILASIVGVFWHSDALQFLISVVGVIVFVLRQVVRRGGGSYGV